MTAIAEHLEVIESALRYCAGTSHELCASEQYAAALAAIAQERAGQQGAGEEWSPLEDGEYKCLHERNLLAIEGDCLSLSDWDNNGTYWASANLPDDVRLCKRTPQPAQGMPSDVAEAIAGLIGFACNPRYMSDESLAMAYTAAKWLDAHRPATGNAGKGE